MLLKIFSRRAGLTLVAAVVFLACGNRPPLRVTNDSKGVKVDVQTLGEYPTTIRKIVLTDKILHRTIWELRATSPESQIADFRLVQGHNPLIPGDVTHGTFAAIVPSAGPTFQLQEGRAYEIRVWGESSQPRVAEFLLADSKE